MTFPTSLSETGGTSAVGNAIAWLQGTLLGAVATLVAVVAVATVGLLMLTGRIHGRRGATTILGCFILFGTPGIAAGLQSQLSSGEMREVAYRVPAPAQGTKPSWPYDPYAGASVPSN